MGPFANGCELEITQTVGCPIDTEDPTFMPEQHSVGLTTECVVKPQQRRVSGTQHQHATAPETGRARPSEENRWGIRSSAAVQVRDQPPPFCRPQRRTGLPPLLSANVPCPPTPRPAPEFGCVLERSNQRGTKGSTQTPYRQEIIINFVAAIQEQHINRHSPSGSLTASPSNVMRCVAEMPGK